MRLARKRLGWTLAALSLAINLLLSVVHLGAAGGLLPVHEPRAPSAVAAASVEARLLQALTEICTVSGLGKRGGDDGERTADILPACPFCLLFAAAALALAAGHLLLVLRRTPVRWIFPPAGAGRFVAFLIHPAQPRAPPSFRAAI